jgi:hypothetical protein
MIVMRPAKRQPASAGFCSRPILRSALLVGRNGEDLVGSPVATRFSPISSKLLSAPVQIGFSFFDLRLRHLDFQAVPGPGRPRLLERASFHDESEPRARPDDRQWTSDELQLLGTDVDAAIAKAGLIALRLHSLAISRRTESTTPAQIGQCEMRHYPSKFTPNSEKIVHNIRIRPPSVSGIIDRPLCRSKNLSAVQVCPRCFGPKRPRQCWGKPKLSCQSFADSVTEPSPSPLPPRWKRAGP